MINRTNIDDIFIRNATIAIMVEMENNLTIEQVEDGIIKEYPIPVFYNKAQDTQFMKDYFTNYSNKCKNIEFVDGDFDREPFAIVNLSGVNIKMNEMTNKFVRGNHVVIEYDDNGIEKKKAASSVLYVIPLSLKYNVSIRTDDNTQSFRIIQSVLEGIFKNDIVHFSFRDLRIRANMSLDANFNHDKKIELSYDDDQKQKIEFSIDVECHYPVFDKTTTLFRGNVIRNFRNFINSNSGTLGKSTVTSEDETKEMKVYNSTKLITREEIFEYQKEGYSVVYSENMDYETRRKIEEQIGPYIINNKQLYLVKYKEENGTL